MVEIKEKEAKHGRFSDLSWYDPNEVIIIGGQGGIGSWLSLFLSRAGYELYLYDDDIIEEHNIGGQLYSTNRLGQNKADAMNSICREFSGNHSIYTLGRYTEDSETSDIVFSCFDSMKARKDLFNNWKQQDNRKMFIDGRMMAEGFQIYAVTPGKEEEYEATLFDDSEIAEQPCSAKATSHCGAIIAGMMMGIFTNNQSNIKLGFYHRDVPFKTTFEIPLMHLKSE